MSLIDQAVHKVRADAADDAKLDQLLAGLGTLTTTITTLTKRLDAVEAEVKKDDAEPVPPKDEHGAKLDKIMDHLEGLHSKHDALKATCDGLNAKHDALCSKHDALAGKVDAMEKAGKEAKAEETEPVPPAIDAAAPATGTKESESEKAALSEERKENGLNAKDSAEFGGKLDAANTQIAGMAKLIADMQKRMPAEIPADQKAHFTAAQSRWEQIAQAFGDSEGVRRPLMGESLADYNRALMSKHKVHSKAWKDKDLDAVPEAVLDVAIEQIHADALAAAKSPAPTVDGVLNAREFKDSMTGRLTRKFYGDIKVMLDLSRNQRQYVTGFPALAARH